MLRPQFLTEKILALAAGICGRKYQDAGVSCDRIPADSDSDDATESDVDSIDSNDNVYLRRPMRPPLLRGQRVVYPPYTGWQGVVCCGAARRAFLNVFSLTAALLSSWG